MVTSLVSVAAGTVRVTVSWNVSVATSDGAVKEAVGELRARQGCDRPAGLTPEMGVDVAARRGPVKLDELAL